MSTLTALPPAPAWPSAQTARAEADQLYAALARVLGKQSADQPAQGPADPPPAPPAALAPVVARPRAAGAGVLILPSGAALKGEAVRVEVARMREAAQVAEAERAAALTLDAAA